MHTNNVPEIGNKHTIQGIILLFGGIILLLYTLGIIQQGINLIFIATAIAMIAYGASSSGLDTLAQNLFYKVLGFFKKK